MFDAKLIKRDMHVIGSDKNECAVVDDAEHNSSAFRVRKDSAGQHHYIPFAWVSSVVDDKVILDRPTPRVKSEWKTTL